MIIYLIDQWTTPTHPISTHPLLLDPQLLIRTTSPEAILPKKHLSQTFLTPLHASLALLFLAAFKTLLFPLLFIPITTFLLLLRLNSRILTLKPLTTAPLLSSETTARSSPSPSPQTAWSTPAPTPTSSESGSSLSSPNAASSGPRPAGWWLSKFPTTRSMQRMVMAR